MRDEYDFSKGRRGAVIGTPGSKTRITIRIDDDVLEWFRKLAHDQGGGSYQTLINQALREHMEHGIEPLEETLRRVLREVLSDAPKPKRKKASKAKRSTKPGARKKTA
jgi:hypothetical protein